MRWLLAGASGFLGTALRERLAREGHEVHRLVRREPATSTEFRWDPATGSIDEAAFSGVQTVVNLCGVPVFGGLWTGRRREAILTSRVDSASTLARALTRIEGDRPTYLQAGGIARYGTSSTQRPYTEDSPAASDFLAQVTVKWEEAAQPAIDAGVRTVLLRTSPVMGASGGPFRAMRLAWSLGLGATLGEGHQRMPMIALDDYLGVVQWAADNDHAQGAYNLTLPQPTTNAAFTDELARQLGRPRFLKAPAALLGAGLGEQAGQLLGDVWAVPDRLTGDGYGFYYADVAGVVTAALR